MIVIPAGPSRDGFVTPDLTRALTTMRFVAWLRDSMALNRPPMWHGTVDGDLDSKLLHHLPPPRPLHDAGPEAPAVLRWRSRHRPGLCYYRHGPGFFVVRDRRNQLASARLLLDDPVSIGTFLRCLHPTGLNEMTEEERAAAETLAEERLLLRAGDLVVTLPHHMRRWPVPAFNV